MKNLKIDIVSDVSCPWCIIGYKGLEQALLELQNDIETDISWLPFELNPNMPPEGQELVEHLTEKYQISVEQCEQNKLAVEQRGLQAGYKFGIRGGGRIFNTFDAHRLLTWSKKYHKQTELKLALFDLYFVEGGDPSDHSQLLNVVEKVGLDKSSAKEVLESNLYEREVRAEQKLTHEKGITSVPAVIIDDKFLISGGQPAATYVDLITKILKQSV